MRLIDADALKEDFAKHEDRKGYLIGDWEDIIDNAPTIEMSYYLYREETCERKAHCFDYKYWHCIGCHGCKADMRGGKQ